MKLDSEMVFKKLRQKAMPRRSCKIQIHLRGHQKLALCFALYALTKASVFLLTRAAVARREHRKRFYEVWINTTFTSKFNDLLVLIITRRLWLLLLLPHWLTKDVICSVCLHHLEHQPELLDSWASLVCCHSLNKFGDIQLQPCVRSRWRDKPLRLPDQFNTRKMTLPYYKVLMCQCMWAHRPHC